MKSATSTLGALKFTRFRNKVSEILSLIICLQSHGLHYKIRNNFLNQQKNTIKSQWLIALKFIFDSCGILLENF